MVEGLGKTHTPELKKSYLVKEFGPELFFVLHFVLMLLGKNPFLLSLTTSYE